MNAASSVGGVSSTLTPQNILERKVSSDRRSVLARSIFNQRGAQVLRNPVLRNPVRRLVPRTKLFPRTKLLARDCVRARPKGRGPVFLSAVPVVYTPAQQAQIQQIIDGR